MPAEPKGGHCQPTTASFEHRPDANNLFTDGEKEALTRKDERRRTGEKKPKTLVSWLKNYRYSAKLNWPKIVSVDKLMIPGLTTINASSFTNQSATGRE